MVSYHFHGACLHGWEDGTTFHFCGKYRIHSGKGADTVAAAIILFNSEISVRKSGF